MKQKDFTLIEHETQLKINPKKSREIDKMITYGRIYKMKKLLGIVVLG